jgi:hypothetical protein
MNCAAHIWCWPDAGHVQRVRASDLADPLDDVLRRERPVRRFLPAERVPGPDVVQLPPPVGQVSLVPRLVLGRDRADEFVDDVLGVAHDRYIRSAVLADLGRVDVGVDDRCPSGECGQLPGHPVVEPGTQRDEQVGLL